MKENFINLWELENFPQDSSFIITSLENIRPIFNRLNSFSPRRIVTPFIS